MNQLFQILMASPQGGEGQNPLVSLWPLLLIIVVFYLFMIRPQVKKQKELRKYRQSLQNGDKVITTGGMYGKIVGVTDQTVVLEVEDQSRIKVDKNAILKDAKDLGEKR
ncbi:MAG: preprotein translocase subunit YajC [Bacteroidales bacterium]|nr:preprotein translocase subunit YajC [Bacteroidales bacterium]MBS3773910.1 preprotein translocase subunit YajC [Bacteroidales bacterium]